MFDEELGIPIEELIGIEQQQPDSRIIPLQDMADFIDNFYTKAGLLNFSRSHRSWHEIHNEELRFINELLDDRIINALLSQRRLLASNAGHISMSIFSCRTLKSHQIPRDKLS